MTAPQQLYKQRRTKAAVIALAFILAGIAWRTLPLGLPRWAYKYGGSFLWGAMVYWVVAAVLPKLRPRYVVIVAMTVAVLTEASRLYHAPALDTFRATLPGRLLLGQYFALRNLVVYGLGIAIAAAIDRFHFWPEVLAALPPKPLGRSNV